MTNTAIHVRSVHTFNDFIRVHKLAQSLSKVDAGASITRGMRATKDRAPAIMHALERMSELAHHRDDAEHGETRRSGSDPLCRIPAQELEAWRNAYETADRGTPEAAFSYLYAAMAIWVGLADPPWEHR